MPDGTVAGFIGSRTMHGDLLHGMAPAFQAGVSCTIGPRTWWARPQIGFYQASASRPYTEPSNVSIQVAPQVSVSGTYDRGEISARTTELDLGLEHAWRWGFLRPSYAAGLCWVHTRVEDAPSFTLLRQLTGDPGTARSDSGAALGGWTSVALDVPLGDAVLGVEGRYTWARATVFDQPIDNGGLQVGAKVSWAW